MFCMLIRRWKLATSNHTTELSSYHISAPQYLVWQIKINWTYCWIWTEEHHLEMCYCWHFDWMNPLWKFGSFLKDLHLTKYNFENYFVRSFSSKQKSKFTCENCSIIFLMEYKYVLWQLKYVLWPFTPLTINSKMNRYSYLLKIGTSIELSNYPCSLS